MIEFIQIINTRHALPHAFICTGCRKSEEYAFLQHSYVVELHTLRFYTLYVSHMIMVRKSKYGL